jgi:hypothetical protein
VEIAPALHPGPRRAMQETAHLPRNPLLPLPPPIQPQGTPVTAIPTLVLEQAMEMEMEMATEMGMEILGAAMGAAMGVMAMGTALPIARPLEMARLQRPPTPHRLPRHPHQTLVPHLPIKVPRQGTSTKVLLVDRQVHLTTPVTALGIVTTKGDLTSPGTRRTRRATPQPRLAVW